MLAAEVLEDQFAARLAVEPGVTQVVSWWTSGRPDALRSRDGSSAVVWPG